MARKRRVRERQTDKMGRKQKERIWGKGEKRRRGEEKREGNSAWKMSPADVEP
jgi:hypothetical protein